MHTLCLGCEKHTDNVIKFFFFLSDCFHQNIRIFQCLNNFHDVIHFFVWIIKVVVSEPCFDFEIPASTVKAAAVISNGTKIPFAKGTAAFINGPANLLNNDPKNPLDGIILKIWALESFMSLDLFQ